MIILENKVTDLESLHGINSTEPPVCSENWQCSEWSVCTNSQQTRTCTDLNSCGTEISKPVETQSCTVDLCLNVVCEDSTLTCSDGFVSTAENTCNPDTGLCSENAPSCEGHELPPILLNPKVIIFQFDDLQAWWLEDTAEAVVELHIEKGVPVTLGVIPESLKEREGEPDSITENLKNWSQNNQDIVEIAVHSYDHSDYSGWGLTQQTDDMKKGISAFNEIGIFGMTTFIPPYNWGNSNTPQAIVDSGLKVGLDSLDNPYIDSTINPMILEGGATYNYGVSTLDSGTWMGLIDEHLQNNDYFVFTYHQQDFSGPNDPDINQLAQLFDDLKASGKYTIMTAGQYYDFVNP